MLRVVFLYKKRGKICESNEWSATCTLAITHNHSQILNTTRDKIEKDERKSMNQIS